MIAQFLLLVIVAIVLGIVGVAAKHGHVPWRTADAAAAREAPGPVIPTSHLAGKRLGLWASRGISNLASVSGRPETDASG
jgi:hypothetical protein